MADIKPVVAVAALMVVILGEGWLRGKVYQFDADYVGILDLVDGMATRIPGRGRASSPLENIGVLTGSIDSAEKVELLRRVKGVSHVEESRQIQIAPPDSPTQ